jgi:hypothetical protein
MLRRFRHSVVDAVLSTTGLPSAPDLSDRVRGFVDGQLTRMPRHLRLGVLATEVLLTTTSAVRRDADAWERWQTSRLFPVASYARLIRGLVLLSAFEFGARA